MAEVWVSCQESMSVLELTLPFICHAMATGTEVMHAPALPLSPLEVGKNCLRVISSNAPHQLQHLAE